MPAGSACSGFEDQGAAPYRVVSLETLEPFFVDTHVARGEQWRIDELGLERVNGPILANRVDELLHELDEVGRVLDLELCFLESIHRAAADSPRTDGEYPGVALARVARSALWSRRG